MFCTGCAVMHEVEQQLEFPAGMNKVHCCSAILRSRTDSLRSHVILHE